MIGKSVALIADARIGAQTNKARVTEVLLRVSGEDAMSVPRKNLSDWEGTLGCRIVFISNEPPSLNDPSGALAARWRVLQMHQSFVGREDRGLDAALEREMPGILLWAIQGARKLKDLGRIEQPMSAADTLSQMKRLASVVVAFVEDRCELKGDGIVSVDALHSCFLGWCRDQGLKNELSKELFGKELTTGFNAAGVRRVRKRADGDRSYHYQGIVVRETQGPHGAFLRGPGQS
jgi:putative DNA primase/helicase